MSGEMTAEALERENAALRAHIANLDLLLEEAKESGKAARRLAKHAMASNGVQGACVSLVMKGEGLRLVICAPPFENEQALGAAIGRALDASMSVLRCGEPMEDTGVKES
jgi:16S rRNA G1207 methylase RsmC